MRVFGPNRRLRPLELLSRLSPVVGIAILALMFKTGEDIRREQQQKQKASERQKAAIQASIDHTLSVSEILEILEAYDRIPDGSRYDDAVEPLAAA